MATVLRAKTAGFCMGVGLALRKLDQALKEHRARSSGRLVMLGPIIHNPQVMNTYMQQGVVLAHSLDAVQPGDTIVFDSVSRMSRSADEGCALYRELYNRGVNLCFLKEPHINTDTYRQALQRQPGAAPQTGSDATDRFVCGIMDALNRYTADLAAEQICLAFAQAQKEVDDLHQRTREGLMTARLNGRQIGQQPGRKLNIKKSAPCKEQIKKYSRDFGGTLTDAECIKLIGIARNTYYKYKRELREMV